MSVRITIDVANVLGDLESVEKMLELLLASPEHLEEDMVRYGITINYSLSDDDELDSQ